MTMVTAADTRKVQPRICIFTETFYPVAGGGETQARTLANSLIARGMDTIVVTRRSSHCSVAQERVGPVSVFRLPPSGRGQHKKWGLLITCVPALIRLRARYDLILVSGFRIVGPAAVLVSRILGKGCILKADSNGEMSGQFFKPGMARVRLSSANLFFRLFLSVRNWMLRRADAFIAIAPDIEEELRVSGVEPSKIRAIPNCVNMEVFRPASQKEKAGLRNSLGLPVQDTIVVYTGRLVSYKGLPLLLRVWKRLAAERSNITLLLVGSGSLDMHNCEAELKQYVSSQHLDDRVLFAGEVPSVACYLKASDILVLPTEKEAFGLSVVEAMACGLAVVATRVGALPTIIHHEVDGLLVSPDSFEELYAVLLRLIDEPEMVVELGLAARESVRERYADSTVGKQYAGLFLELAGG